MSKKLTRNFKVAHDAIEQLATTPGTSPFDRAELLARLRNRVSDHIVRISGEAEQLRGPNPVAQDKGD